jgi:tRNA threonylcarbamoyladenosine biosynthesis protein TsaB
MIPLALETSGMLGSIAMVEDAKIITEEEFPQGFKHAAGIISLIDRLTRSRGWRPADVAEVYVSAGPGSFTGLRVGITVAKTLAFSLGARLVAVPSTEVLAYNAYEGWQNAIIVLDAKRGQVFTARYENRRGEAIEVEPPHLDTLADMLRRAPRPVQLIGDGIPYHQAAIPTDDPGVIVLPKPLGRARAGVVARLGLRMSADGQFTEPDQLTPLYIRRPEAEEKWDEMRGREARRHGGTKEG